jgi:methyl-accepting chemotaxis protein
MPGMRSLLAVLILSAAIVAAGCGGDSSSSSSSGGTGTESSTTAAGDWANSVCQAFNDWNSSITEAAQSVRDNPTEDGIKTAGDDIRSATDTLADDLKGLDRPDTESGQEAKAAIDELATSLETSMQKITDAVDNASGASGLVTAGSTIATTLTEMGSQVSTTGQQLENIDAGGELQSAFEQADSCSRLTTTT